MAMPSGNVVISDKMHGGEIHQHQWFMDERDGFINWLRSEFAAANAIIDSVCHHLRAVGYPGEYDAVIGTIQQRRCNWNTVLHMQHYFSVADVTYALQQVAWKRQQRYFDPVKAGPKEFKRSSGAAAFNNKQGQRFEVVKERHNSGAESQVPDGNSSGSVGNEKRAPSSDKTAEMKLGGKFGKMMDGSDLQAEEKNDVITKANSNSSLKSSDNSTCQLESETVVNDVCTAISEEDGSYSGQRLIEKQTLSSIAKTFVSIETYDGKKVNVVDGLKLHEELLDDTEVSKLVSLVNDLRAAGRRGKLQGQTYMVSKRPMKGHGRETIQLGVPIIDAPPEEETRSFKDRKVESIPSVIQDIIRHVDSAQILTVKPDACIVDFYNEGDHSQPYNWPPWFGRPICLLFLTECEMTFGRVITSDHPGDYRGSLKLSLGPGSLLMMEGTSTDFSKYAISSLRKQRILVTMTKTLSKKSLQSDGRLLSPNLSSHWGPPPSRSPNHIRHHGGPKPYAAAPMTTVLPVPPIHPQLPAPTGIQPLFVTTPVASALPFPAPIPIPSGSTGWQPAQPRHPPPRIPLPGTGVFLPPPGSSNAAPQQLPSSTTEVKLCQEPGTLTEEESGSGGEANHVSPAAPEEKMERQDCNGSISIENSQQVEERESLGCLDNVVGGNPAGSD